MKKIYKELIGIGCVVLDAAAYAIKGPSDLLSLALAINMAAIICVCLAEDKKSGK